MPSIAVPVALNSYGISCYLDRKGKRKSRTFFAQSKHFDFCETVSSEQNITNRSNAMLGSLHSGQCHENNQSFTIHSLQVVSLFGWYNWQRFEKTPFAIAHHLFQSQRSVQPTQRACESQWERSSQDSVRTSSDQKHTKPSHCEELDSTKTAVFAVLRALKPCQKLAASEFLDALLLSTPWDVLDGLIRLRQKPVEIRWTSQVHRQPRRHTLRDLRRSAEISKCTMDQKGQLRRTRVTGVCQTSSL